MNMKHENSIDKLLIFPTIISVLVVAIIIITSRVYANVAVIDSANLANSAKQVEAWRQQLEHMKQQLSIVQKQYDAIVGNRGLGYAHYNQQLNQYLPDNYAEIYSNFRQVNNGLVNKINNGEKLNGSCKDIQQQINFRSKNTILTDKAVNLQSYEVAKQRLSQLDSLMNQIDQTQDVKSVGELQARIEVEQLAVQNELIKLQLVSHLQNAEQQLILEQKRELNRRLLGNNNNNMPRIK